MVHPSRKTVWSLLNCCAVFWIWLSTVHWFRLLLCVWVLFLFAGTCACCYQLAMVTGGRCTIVFLPEKLKSTCSRVVYTMKEVPHCSFFLLISRLPERMTKKKKLKRFSISWHVIRGCVCVPFQQGSQVIITYLDEIILKKKILILSHIH